MGGCRQTFSLWFYTKKVIKPYSKNYGRWNCLKELLDLGIPKIKARTPAVFASSVLIGVLKGYPIIVCKKDIFITGIFMLFPPAVKEYSCNRIDKKNQYKCTKYK